MDTIELLAEISILKERLKNSVEVVRCKDCKHWHEDVANFISSIPRGGCKLVRGLTNGEFFCALGERKEINSR